VVFISSFRPHPITCVFAHSLTALRPNLQVLVEWREKDADYRAKVDRLDHSVAEGRWLMDLLTGCLAD